MDKLRQSIKDHSRFFESIKIQPEDIDYNVANSYLPFFKMIDSLQTGLVISFDFYKRDYFYYSEHINETFGFFKNKLPFVDHKVIRSRFHPDDYIINTGSIQTLHYFYQLPIERRKDLRLIHEFRILNDANKWIRLIVQNDILELDKKGNIWLDLKLWDFSPEQNMDAPGRFVCRNKSTGKIIIAMESPRTNGVNISSREKEVLGLIAQGMRSKEIADKLYISANTVNNHRRKLLKKMHVSNSSEAVILAMKLGVI